MKYWILGLFLAGCVLFSLYMFLDERKRSADSGPMPIGVLALMLWAIAGALLAWRLLVLLWGAL